MTTTADPWALPTWAHRTITHARTDDGQPADVTHVRELDAGPTLVQLRQHVRTLDDGTLDVERPHVGTWIPERLPGEHALRAGSTLAAAHTMLMLIEAGDL